MERPRLHCLRISAGLVQGSKIRIFLLARHNIYIERKRERERERERKNDSKVSISNKCCSFEISILNPKKKILGITTIFNIDNKKSFLSTKIAYLNDF